MENAVQQKKDSLAINFICGITTYIWIFIDEPWSVVLLLAPAMAQYGTA